MYVPASLGCTYCTSSVFGAHLVIVGIMFRFSSSAASKASQRTAVVDDDSLIVDNIKNADDSDSFSFHLSSHSIYHLVNTTVLDLFCNK